MGADAGERGGMKTGEEHIKEITMTTWVNVPQIIDIFSKHLIDLENDYKTELSEAMEIINSDDKLMFHISLKHENERLVRANKELEATIQKYDDFFKGYGIGVSIPFDDWIELFRPEGLGAIK